MSTPNTDSDKVLSQEDRCLLIEAKALLENPGLAIRLSDIVGMPMEKALQMLPNEWQITLQDITRKALNTALDTALVTMRDTPGQSASAMGHKLGVALSGGVGGFFGLGAIAVELPISTTIMLRAIAAVARSEGERIQDLDTKIACLEVFALGGKSRADDSAEAGYFAVRTALARAVSESAQHVAQKGFSTSAAPVLVKWVAAVAERFGVQVSQKVAAQSVPAIGATGGAMVNTLFIDHFQNMARGHFLIRRLERRYSESIIRESYVAVG